MLKIEAHFATRITLTQTLAVRIQLMLSIMNQRADWVQIGSGQLYYIEQA